MNERIKELREQSRTLVSNEERDRGELYEAREQWERCDQKFAELIVKECVRYFNEDYERNFETLWREDLSKGMKEHFGVEE